MGLLRTLKFIVNHPINRAHPLAAALGFVRWQLGSRLLTGPAVYEWVSGSRFIVQCSEEGLTGNIYCGLHKFPYMACLLHSVSEHDCSLAMVQTLGRTPSWPAPPVAHAESALSQCPRPIAA